MHIKMNEIKQHLEFLKKMYQVVRIVEPSTKKVFVNEGDLSAYKDGFCYSFWEIGSYCENCVSYRARIEDDIVYKLEYAPDKVFMVTAMPIKTEEKVVVIEMLKEITDSIVIDTLDNKDKEAMKDYIMNINNKIVKDELTEIFNRRFINERLPVDVIQSKIYKYPMSIIMTDIDYFRDINNTYGHLEGDKKIKEYANILSDAIKGKNNWVARYGGDEFIICLVNTGKEEAMRIANELRDKVFREMIPMEDNKPITGSFGVYTMSVEEPKTAQELIEIADFYLYKAKGEGRNRIYAEY